METRPWRMRRQMVVRDRMPVRVITSRQVSSSFEGMTELLIQGSVTGAAPLASLGPDRGFERRFSEAPKGQLSVLRQPISIGDGVSIQRGCP